MSDAKEYEEPEFPRVSREAHEAAAKGWTETPVTIVGKSGESVKPGYVHPDVPGLAVTMNYFGYFGVTHLATGFRVGPPFERAGGAMEIAVELTYCADFLQGQDALMAELKEHGDEPCGVPGTRSIANGVERHLTKMELVQLIRSSTLSDEFPWEASDDSPDYRATP